MAFVQVLGADGIWPSPEEKPKIESNEDDVEFSDEDYDDYVYISDYDEEEEDAEKEAEIFRSQFDNSEGFDVNFRELKYGYFVRPVSWKERGLSSVWKELTGGELMKKLTIFAIDKHNFDKGEKLKLVKLVKANWHFCTGRNFYITCRVKDLMDDGKLKTYQVEVQNFVDDIIVHMVREKPECKGPCIDVVNC